MPEDQKNFIFALALSLLVIIGWEFFYSPTPAPKLETFQAPIAKKVISPLSKTTINKGNVWGNADISSTDNKSIKIKTNRVDGSFQQKGAVFDNLLITDYRQSVDKQSPPVHFLKRQKLDAYFGWSGINGEIINDATNWKIVSSKNLTQNNKIILSYEDKKTKLQFKREISIDENYMFQIKDSVFNPTNVRQQISAFGRIRRLQRPEVSGFYLSHEGLIGFFPSIGLEEIDYDDLEDEPKIEFNSDNGWLGFTDKYWAAALIPNQDYSFNASFIRVVRAGNEIFTTQYVSQPLILEAGARTEWKQNFFAGAKENDLVEKYTENLPIARFDLIIDWGWFFFMTKPFFGILDFFSRLIGNFGLSILIVTVLVKLAFFPLASKSYETMAVMRKVQPDIERIRARNKSDMMAQNREIAEIWKKHNVKPLMGCLPMLLQIPVFFALYKVLFVTIEMRHAPFFGWVQDLSAADPTSLLTLFGLLPITLPDFLIIGVWPLLMGATMFVQMRLNPPPPDPIQRKIFAWAPVVITLLLARFPVGLVIYATWNTILSAAQQAVIMKRQGVKIDLFNSLGIRK